MTRQGRANALFRSLLQRRSCRGGWRVDITHDDTNDDCPFSYVHLTLEKETEVAHGAALFFNFNEDNSNDCLREFGTSNIVDKSTTDLSTKKLVNLAERRMKQVLSL